MASIVTGDLESVVEWFLLRKVKSVKNDCEAVYCESLSSVLLNTAAW